MQKNYSSKDLKHCQQKGFILRKLRNSYIANKINLTHTHYPLVFALTLTLRIAILRQIHMSLQGANKKQGNKCGDRKGV